MIRDVCLVVVAVLVSTLISLHLNHRSQLLSVNLTKILNAQRMLIVRGSTLNQNAWISQAQNASKSLKAAISKIAHGHAVMISQSVIAGSVDITPQVLRALGLPQNVPDITPSRSQVLGSGLFVSKGKQSPMQRDLFNQMFN